VTRSFLIALCSAGCSLAMTRPDPARARDKAPVCDTGKGPVVLDAVMASILGTAALGLVGSSSSSAQSTAIVPAIFGAIYLGSSVHGNSVANECRKAMEDFGAPPPIEQEPAVVVRRHPKPAAPTVAALPPPVPIPVPVPPKQDDEPWASFWKELP
jgi:hypothetical protein